MSTSLTQRPEKADGAAPARRHPESLARDAPALLTTADATRLWGAQELKRALRMGEWIELWGAVVPADRVHDRSTLAAAALLRTGQEAVLSGATAVAMHGCVAAAQPATEVTIPYSRQVRSRPGLVVRQGTIRESEVVELDGMRTHALDVALAELLCTGQQPVAAACLDQALQQAGPVRARQLHALVAERVARRADRRGTKRAAAILDVQRRSQR